MARRTRLILRFLARITPWIIRLFWSVVVAVGNTLRAVLQGVLPECEKKATDWTNEAIQSGDLPNGWAKYIYPVMYAVALLTWVVCWAIQAWLIVVILQKLFIAFI